MIWIICISVLLMSYWFGKIVAIRAEMKRLKDQEAGLKERMKQELADIEKRNAELRLKIVASKSVSPTNPPVPKKEDRKNIERSVYDSPFRDEDKERKRLRDNDDFLNTLAVGISLASMLDDTSSSSSSFDSGSSVVDSSSDWSGGGGDFSGGGSSGDW